MKQLPSSIVFLTLSLIPKIFFSSLETVLKQVKLTSKLKHRTYVLHSYEIYLRSNKHFHTDKRNSLKIKTVSKVNLSTLLHRFGKYHFTHTHEEGNGCELRKYFMNLKQNTHYS
jgi:hypothetical protein